MAGPCADITAGMLSHRVLIQSPTNNRSASGQFTQSWSTVATRWASVQPISGKEFFGSNQTDARVTHKVKIRYMAAVTPEYRVVYKTRNLNIRSVINVNEEDVEHILLCEEDVSNTGS